ncbi:DUF5011 domain-containing protein [Paenibacillus antri]|uniref:DUF5011 domain-containing protein n=1 Tax=Paenibacillus antri TaxID=2582848 RepID=A0A5R9G3T9_9BACL|nr:DUF5011 domain-containing protein [Paenibacillus antri]TLS51047.1 DUF5011 domain-containing protein [Paenibacillus antri]
MKRVWISLLAVCLLVAMAPVGGIPQAEASGGDVEIRLGGALIGNLSHQAENALINFQIGTQGFEYGKNGNFTVDFAGGETIMWRGDEVSMTIRVQDNPLLSELAGSGHAEVDVGWSGLKWAEECETEILGICVDKDYQGTNAQIRVYDTVNNSTDLTVADEAWHGGVGASRGSVRLKKTSAIHIVIKGVRDRTGDPTGVRGLYVKFKDTQRPTMTGYQFDGDGAERQNEKINQRELYAKRNEDITLTYKFDEPIYPYELSLAPAISDPFLKHPLFTNTAGTGLPAAGQAQYLENTTYKDKNFKKMTDHLTYNYTGVKYHNSGNLPLKPYITGTTPSGAPVEEKTLQDKFKDAVLIDAAGNVAELPFPGKALPGSEIYLLGKTVNPFDFENGGFRVIVDAVAPKYSKVGNGIQPEILTGVTLNKDDTIDFSVQFTEEMIVNREPGWETKDTYLLFNNGMKAYYKSGSGSDKWTFTMTIPDGKSVEVPLLKAIALTHNNKLTDKAVIHDYAGNMLVQPANFEGENRDDEGNDPSLVNSKIDWARLQVDNTKPDIRYIFENGGASDTQFQKNGKVTIDANDPDLIVPSLEPIGDDRGKPRPSRGVYRPSNMSGASSVGLVYYYWSQSPTDPFAGKEADNFAAVKRFSISAKQPREDLYSGDEALAKVNLTVANNKTNMIPPPAEALLEEKSGDWYLHTWTADMTWDTARELMQYEKAKTYLDAHPAERDAWLAEAPGASDADKLVYARNKAIEKVGQYGDVSIWTLEDFKHADSNWTYNKTVFKLDNKAPTIVSHNMDNNKPIVTADVHLSDANLSGIASVFYQWVADGSEPADVDWKSKALSGEALSVTTQGEIYEDGKYWLYVKMKDNAGNERVVRVEEAAIVDSTSRVSASFEPTPSIGYVQSHDVVFTVSGFDVPDVTGAVYGNAGMTVTEATYASVGFAVAASPAPPSDDGAYASIAPFASDAAGKSASYRIPANTAWSGAQTVHVKVTEPDGRKHYFSKTYLFDNAAPTVLFSKDGVSYPLKEQSVAVGISKREQETIVSKYKWVRAEAPAPTAEDAGWIDLPEGGTVVIDARTLAAGEIADFRLYVFVEDESGNRGIVTPKGPFKVSNAGASTTPPAQAKTDLVYLYGDEEDGYTAIVKLDLATEDKTGYDVSVSPDGGTSWIKWRPYTNFVSVKVPTNVPGQLRIQVKFRTPGGAVSEPYSLDISAFSAEQPVYALATLNTTRPVSPATGVDIQITPPLGIRVNASDVNPATPSRKGNTFHVNQNGYYSFDLTDLADPTRTDTLYVVVYNVDGTAPIGSVEYVAEGGATPAKTNGNVSVRLSTSEPVKVINNGGRSVYTFTENGTFTFMFQDEAGNEGTATATVDVIDKEAPQVRFVRSYMYGTNFSQQFGTVRDEQNNVLFSSGVTLTLEKADPNGKNFDFLETSNFVTLTENGTASFRIGDEYGNVTIVKETVDNIVSAPPQPASVAYKYVDDAGNPLAADKIVTIDGKTYAKGKVQVTVSGQTDPRNPVFAGASAIPGEGGVGYANKISGEDGTFAYSKVFSAEGKTTIGLADLVGNVNRIPIQVAGLDNKAPELTLNRPVVAIAQNKAGFDFKKDLGGYAASDNVSKPENIEVTIGGLDLAQLGRQRVTYTAKDQVGNVTTATQDVVVVATDGMLILANDVLISGASAETALFDTNKLSFEISRYNLVDVKGQERVNEWGTYDIYYQPGLYREGQMKLLAKQVSLKELQSLKFQYTFPDVGWYTIIVRNQERERDFAMFFVSGKE